MNPQRDSKLEPSDNIFPPNRTELAKRVLLVLVNLRENKVRWRLSGEVDPINLVLSYSGSVKRERTVQECIRARTSFVLKSFVNPVSPIT